MLHLRGLFKTLSDIYLAASKKEYEHKNQKEEEKNLKAKKNNNPKSPKESDLEANFNLIEKQAKDLA